MSASPFLPFAICLITFFPFVLTAQEQQDPTVSMVVTPDRVERPRWATASAVTTITGEELRQKGITQVAEALRAVAGIDVVRSGGPGGNTAVFIRGANSEHTLLLIDGVEANNPANPTRAFNFSDLSVDEIERIEILRGPQSTLYGSEAIGGVIQIITKRATTGPSAEASFEGGSYTSYTERASFGYGSDALSANVGVTRQDSAGFSAAEQRDGNNEHDGFENSSFAGRVEAHPNEWLQARLTLRGNNSRTEIDNQGGQFGDDPNRRVNNEQLFLRSEGSANFFDGVWRPQLSFSYADHQLNDDNDPDNSHPLDLLRSNYDGRLFSYSFQNNIRLSESSSMIAGIDTEEEQASSQYYSESAFGSYRDALNEQHAHTTGYYTQGIFTLGEHFSTTAGVRVDDHSKFGNETTWRVAPVLRSNEWGTSLKATAGTGYKAPSLIQLYSSFGNPELDAEKSLGFDVGIEQQLCDSLLTFESRFFWNEFENLITFNPSTLVLENINEARSRGVESSLQMSLHEQVTTSITWTYTDTEDEETNLPLLRRARNKLAADITYHPREGTKILLSSLASSDRADNDFSSYPPSRATLTGYGIINLSAVQAIYENIDLTLRVDNLLDKNYQEVLGYGTAGISVFGGLKVSL